MTGHRHDQDWPGRLLLRNWVGWLVDWLIGWLVGWLVSLLLLLLLWWRCFKKVSFESQIRDIKHGQPMVEYETLPEKKHTFLWFLNLFRRQFPVVIMAGPFQK